MKKRDLAGLRFGRWTVVSFGKAHSRIYWKCRCDCGVEREVQASNLTTGGSKSCGCLDLDRKKTRRLASWEPAFNALLNSYRGRAKRKKWEWLLSSEEFLALTTSECWLCGSKPAQVRTARSKTKWCSEFYYNGIDRLDSDVGYTPENCRAACWNCNRMKGSLSVQEFEEAVKKIVSHRKLNP